MLIIFETKAKSLLNSLVSEIQQNKQPYVASMNDSRMNKAQALPTLGPFKGKEWEVTQQMKSKSQIMLLAKTITIIAFIAIFFYQDLAILFTDAIKETTLYMLIVPFLTGYIIYSKRKLLGAVGVEEEQFKSGRTDYISQVIGILFALLAISIYWFGTYTLTQIRYHMLALPLLIIGLVLLLFNYNTFRHIAFPIVLLFFLVPPPSEIVYSIGGNLLFLGTLLLVIISEKLFKKRVFSIPNGECLQYTPTSTSNKIFCLECGRITNHFTTSVRKTDIAKISSLAVVAVILLSFQAPIFALTQIKPIVAVTTTTPGEQVSHEILPEIQGYTLILDNRDKKFEASAKLDMALVYLYKPKNLNEDEVWVTIEIGTSSSYLPRWETRLITNPVAGGLEPEAIQIALGDEELLQNPSITARFFVFNYTKTLMTQAVLYWFENAPFNVNSTFQQKRIKISVTTYPENLIELPSIHNKMIAVATQIAGYWQPIKTWSQTTLILSANSQILVLIICAALALGIIMTFLEKRRTHRNNVKTYHKLSNANKTIIDAVQQTEQTSIPTIKNIAITIQKQTDKAINKTALIAQLQELEKTGLIKSDITNIKDEPIQTWKTQDLSWSQLKLRKNENNIPNNIHS